MSNIVDAKFNEWVQGKNAIEARMTIYERIRDIPYAAIPELIDFERYVEILRVNKGSCTPKHLLLCTMYQRLGLEVLYAVYPFRWDEVEIDYPPRLRMLAEALPTDRHLACKVDIEGRLVLVDATFDLALKKMGLPVNEDWDGKNDTLLAVEPCGEEQLFHPSEAYDLRTHRDERSLVFYQELNLWLDEVRKL